MKNADRLRSTLIAGLSAAGNILIQNLGKARVSYKGRANLVTQSDHASEQAILDIIARRFPEHDFLTEERAPKKTGSDFTWVIDPLDGTTNYAHGYPLFCVSIGLLHKGRPLLGGVFDPWRKEMFLAQSGRGALLNNRRLRVSRTRRLEESLLATGFAYDRAERAAFYLDFYRRFMQNSHDVRRSGSAALDLAWVAAGRSDGFWEFSLKPWDVSAGLLLVIEAGGRVTDFSGKTWKDPETFGRETLASNGSIHLEMLRFFGK